MADNTTTNWEDFTPGPGDKPLNSISPSAKQDDSWGDGDKPAPASLLRKAGDLGLSVAKGVIAVPEAAVGLADIATGGEAGKFLENEGGAYGVRFKQAKQILSDMQSDDLQGKQREFQQADGIIDKTKTALSNPSLITNAVAESVPLMGAGAVPARAALAVAPKVGALAAGAIGEGVVGAGSAAEQVRQETQDGLLTPKQAGLAAASGAATAAFGMAGGKLAQRLGIGDVDTMLAQGAAKTAGVPSAKSIPRQVVEGAIAEGWLEELPQSVSEQILQNLSLNKPWSEGVEDAAVMGTLAGMAMGGTAAGVSGFSERGDKPADQAPPPAQPPAPVQGTGPTLALPAPERGVIQVGGDGTARTPAYQAPGYVGDVTDVQSRPIDPVREQVAAAAEQGGALSGAALTAIDTGVTQAMQPVAPEAAPPAPISLEEADARDQAAYEQFFANHDFDPVVSRYFEDDTDIPDFGAASNVSDEEFLRSLGATDEDIQDAIATASQPSIPQSRPAVDAGAQANEPAGPRQGAGADQAAQGQVAATPAPSAPTNLRDALVNIRAQKQEAANAQAAAPQATPAAATVPGARPAAVEAAGPAVTPPTQGVAREPSPDQTVQASAQPSQAAAAPAAEPTTASTSSPAAVGAPEVRALTDGTPAQNLGAQVAAAPGAKAAAPAGQKKALDRVNAGKAYYFSQAKAQAFVDDNGLSDTHEVVQDNKRFVVRAKPAADDAGDVRQFAPETGTLGIPRAEMPQVPTQSHGGLVKHLNAQGIEHETTMVDAAELKPTQAEFSPSKVEQAKEAIGDRAVIVSNDGHIIDGHHQALAAAEDGKPVKAIVLDAPVEQALEAVKNSPSAQAQPAEPAAPTKPAKKPRGILAKKAEAEAKARADYFTPGNVVKGYGGFDRVLEYTPVDERGSWSVRVQRVLEQDGQWADAPNERPRWHSTQPEARVMAAGPVMKTPVAAEQPAVKAELVKRTGAKIEDFGETLHGARKMLYAEAYADGMAKAKELDTKAHPLSKTWPEPDYQKLLEGGAPLEAVSLVRALREAVPTKPQSSWKLKGWSAQVETLRGFAEDVLSGQQEPSAVRIKLNRDGMPRGVADKVALYEAMGHERSLKGINVSVGRYSMYDRVEYNPPRTIWSVSREAKSSAFGSWPRELAKGDTREEAIAAFKKRAAELLAEERAPTKGATFEIYGKRAGGAREFFIGKKIGRNVAELKTGFADIKAARQYLADNQTELEGLLDKYKAVPPVRNDQNAPRIGEDYRKGADVNPAQFQDAFGFRGVQFGNYVEGGRRQQDLNRAYDALMDLAGVLNVPPKALSLGGRLGLAFGARGTGGTDAAAAHYERGNVVINLTKREGAGSLAHEWWHSLDNYFSRERGAGDTYMTLDSQSGTGVREEMRAAFREVNAAINRTGMQERSRKLDERKTKDYWTTKPEMSARAFESYVIAKLQDQNAGNDYLANVLPASAFALEGGYPYPTAGELPVIRGAFDAFFQTVETKQGEGGETVLFSRTPETQSAYDARIDALFSGDKPRMKGARVLDRSDMLTFLGLGDGPVNLAESKVIAGQSNHPHMTAAVRKQIPEWLENPALVFESDTAPGRLVFIAPELVNGSPVRIVVEPNAAGGVNAHLLVNAYDAQSNAFRRWDSDGLLRYVDRNKYAHVSGTFQPQLTGLPGDRGRNRILTDKQYNGYRRANTPAAFQGPAPEPTKLSNARLVATQMLVDEIKAKWTRSPEIIVARNMQDMQIPQLVRDYDAQLKSQGSDGEARGFIYKGKVYLLADQLNGPAQIAEVLFHEVLGHYGLRGAFGDGLTPVLQQIGSMRRAQVLAKAREYGMVQKGLSDSDTWAALSARDRLSAAEEVLAEMAQTTPEIGFVQRAIAAIRTWLRANVPGFKALALTDDEIVRSYILPARGYVTRSDETPQQSLQRALLAFDRDAGGDALPMFSRSGMADLTGKAREELNKTFGAPGKLSWWHKTVGTMFNLAERSPDFKRVFDSAQGFVDDVSYYATDAAELAPRLLPKLETWRDIAKRPITAADNAAVAKPVFEGTLDWARDESGKPVRLQTLLDAAEKLTPQQKAQRLLRNNKISEGMLKAWQGLPLEQYEKLVASRYESQMLQAGVVWTPAELKSLFKLTDAQVELYQEFRAATDRSLDTMARADMLRYGGKDVAELRDMVMDAKDAQDAAQILRNHLQMLAKENPDRAGEIGQLSNGMLDRAARVQELQEQGYAPLSRFGQYTVDVVNANGERQYFGLFETAREANVMAIKMRKEFGQDAVTQGTLSNDEFKLLAGITPESLELFGNMLGLESDGDQAKDQAFQEYLRRTKTNRSAMRRLIHRQGIAGYSEDVGRVLASFIYSNSRQTSAGLHMGELGEAITAIPKQQGELKDAAIQLSEYVKNPQEEAQAVRGLLFAQYLGGSIASAFVNMSQPAAVTFPWLSQFGGAKQAAAELGRAAKNLANRGHRYEADLAAALKQAEEEGTVSPQEVHQLMAQARGSGSLRPGDGTRAGDARAAASNALTRLSLAWGKVFGAAEQVNRRMTFIAAYRVAKAQGMANPAAFAKKAVIETQFTYSKANKMKWGRGAVGATAMTFKTYSIAYLELLGRMWTQGGPEGKKAVLLALGMLMLMGGAGGLPFAEDAEDLVDGLAQLAGYNFNSKKAKQELLESLFGEAGAGFIERGITGLPGMPLDVSGRLGMGNLLPATGLFKEKTDYTRDVLEVVGPVGDLAKRVASGARSILAGDVGAGLLQMAPAAVRNAAKGADMAATGMYRDDKGYKVLDTSPAEAAMKAIGFQPASVSKVQEANFINQQAKNFYNQQAQEIRAKWAKGIFEKDPALVAEARADLEDWNRKNPDQRIVVSMPAVLKRVREMGKSKDQRIADTAPKAMRQQLREEAAKARATL
ncbi:PLxRFG domain-containing protein [Acidovorax sp. K2F]|uniref:PLxRFG domain-containing protein n=1 Tax=Acidovorax sp. K2F TaxID=2978125 RepID=UPI0021B08F7B|nr:PLxRFG domain-containing protein [Acidovorax sp. K2F]MCT6719425.1 PLxRFG domain-containing protein [Acidovorax sp. K2F]